VIFCLYRGTLAATWSRESTEYPCDVHAGLRTAAVTFGPRRREARDPVDGITPCALSSQARRLKGLVDVRKSMKHRAAGLAESREKVRNDRAAPERRCRRATPDRMPYEPMLAGPSPSDVKAVVGRPGHGQERRVKVARDTRDVRSASGQASRNDAAALKRMLACTVSATRVPG